MMAVTASQVSKVSGPKPNPQLPSLPVRLLVFDLDGTLIDSSTDLCNSVNAALLHAGRRQLSPLQITSFIGHGAATLMRRALAASLHVTSPDTAEAEALYWTGRSNIFLNIIETTSWTIRTSTLAWLRRYGTFAPGTRTCQWLY